MELDITLELAEEWRDVKGFEGHYRVSNKGRVMSVERMVDTPCHKGKRLHTSRMISLRLHNKGYLTTSLWKTIDGERMRKQVYLHRLVAEHFIPNPNEYGYINHINNDRADNRVENLEWCTAKQNSQHAKKQGRLKSPCSMGWRSGTQPYRVELIDGTLVGEFASLSDAMIFIGENPQNHTPRTNATHNKPYKGKYIFKRNGIRKSYKVSAI